MNVIDFSATKTIEPVKHVAADDETQRTNAPIPTGCSYCSERVRVVSFNQLHPGDHICQGGNSFTKNVNRNQKYVYEHHAIVKLVICVEGTDQRAAITLIHYYSTSYDAEIRIRETNEIRDLRLDEIYIVRYRYPKFQSNQVLYRAQKALENDPGYLLPVLNCEHFCTWCITGEERSYQVEKVKEILKNILDYLLGYLSRTVKVIDLPNSSREISLVAATLSIAEISVYFIENMYTHKSLRNNFKKGTICNSCYNFNISNIVVSLTALNLLIVSNIINDIQRILIDSLLNDSWYQVTILVLLSDNLLTIVWKCTKYYKDFRSPFRGDKTRVYDSRNIQMGDVIQYRYWKLLHEAVVSSVAFSADGKQGKIRVVHYGLQSLTSQSEIMEEEIKFDLNKIEIFKHDYSRYTVYPPDEVVRRARKRLEERKFDVITNRSCHFCHWAKVNESYNTISTFDNGNNPSFDLAHLPHQIYTDQSANRPSSSQLVDKTWIKITSEVKGGDLIQFRYHGHWHNGVCTEVSTESARQLTIKVVHYSYQGQFDLLEVKEEIFNFDMSITIVYIYNYHPAHKYSRTQIINRARTKIGEKKYSMSYINSSHLVEEIALKDKEQVINSPSELAEGDIVSFSYRGIPDQAILVSIVNILGDAKCWISVIHYSAGSLFATPTVVEEKLYIDLAENNLRKVNFQEYFTYPGNIVVERARKRLGEQKFHLSPTTQATCKDIYFSLRGTKYSLFLDSANENQNQTSNQQTHHILSFNTSSVKKKKGQMYAELVRSWEEFIPGHIVEFKYYWIWHQGILTDVDSRNEKIKIVHYGAKHPFSKRTILEDEMKVNLKKKSFYIYHPDPKYSHTPEEVIRNAKSRVGEQKWRQGNRSYDFCRACVLRERRE
ncbi:hypothetical protein ACJMK2_037787 [Sinanodonta woodiana]|uniref:LRAT domain-containing protein n=1 Tax=Sinanodonta woodiana TaxID=1069815 RepID=A0ABD3WQR8_SINWO